MSEGVNENADFSSGEEEVTPTEPEAVPEPVLEPEVEMVSPVTEEGGGIEAAATGETIREQGEPIEASTVEQPQLALQTKPKKQTTKTTIVKIQRSLADASKQIEKQTTQINKISQNLQSLQNQLKSEQRQSKLVNQIRSQVNQIQKQVSQVQKSIQKRSTNIIQSSKKVANNKKKNKK
jgi:methyl-accepting chemotaxis protein